MVRSRPRAPTLALGRRALTLAEPSPLALLLPLPLTHQINLKFNEGLSAWPAFAADPSRFAALFARVIELPAERAAAEGAPVMSDDEHTRCPSP